MNRKILLFLKKTFAAKHIRKSLVFFLSICSTDIRKNRFRQAEKSVKDIFQFNKLYFLSFSYLGKCKTFMLCLVMWARSFGRFSCEICANAMLKIKFFLKKKRLQWTLMHAIQIKCTTHIQYFTKISVIMLTTAQSSHQNRPQLYFLIQEKYETQISNIIQSLFIFSEFVRFMLFFFLFREIDENCPHSNSWNIESMSRHR